MNIISREKLVRRLACTLLPLPERRLLLLLPSNQPDAPVCLSACMCASSCADKNLISRDSLSLFSLSSLLATRDSQADAGAHFLNLKIYCFSLPVISFPPLSLSPLSSIQRWRRQRQQRFPSPFAAGKSEAKANGSLRLSEREGEQKNATVLLLSHLARSLPSQHASPHAVSHADV